MTDQPEALMQWARDAGSTPEDLVRFATLTIADRDAEIEQLRAHLSLDWKMISEQREEIARLRGALKRIKTLMRELAREALEVKT